MKLLLVLSVCVTLAVAQDQKSWGNNRNSQQQQTPVKAPNTGHNHNHNHNATPKYPYPSQPQVYHAPRRAVDPPRVNREIRLKFLKLFHHDETPSEHKHNNGDASPCPEVTPELRNQSRLPANILEQIDQLCPCNTFFYSFAVRHLNATRMLQQAFLDRIRNLPNRDAKANELLDFAKHELNLHIINKRVWYYALLGAVIAEPDLNGYYLASPVDATPDMYIPFSIIKEATAGSRRPIRETTINECVTANGARTSQKILEGRVMNGGQSGRPGGNGGQGQADNRPGGGNGNNRPPNQGNIPESPWSSGAQSWPTTNNNRRTRQRPRRFANYTTTIVFEEKARRAPATTSHNSRPPKFPSGQPPNRGGGGNGQQPRCIQYMGTRGTSQAENQLWYFREDVMLNEHHWMWHQYYPGNASRHPDRRGEAFFYTHHNIIARYNAERLSNGLEREVPMNIRLNENIGPHYDPDLVDMQSGKFWTPRAANTLLTNLNHLNDSDFQMNIDINTLGELHQLLRTHINEGYLQFNRTLREGQPPTIYPVPIRTQQGFNHLGNTIEASEQLSTSIFHYNDTGVHNLAHIAVGLASDPDFRCQRPTGVMADLTVTFRDPAFYKVHTMVDELFDQHKRTLTPYQLHDGEWPLIWDGIEIINLETFDLGTGGSRNYLTTYWSVKTFPLEQGIDYSIHSGDVDTNICHVHLNHSPFTFQLTVDVQNSSSRGTVRLFMAPRYDLNGRRFTMNETRKLMFQLDAFPVELKRGRNIITRHSQDSSSTKPWSRNVQDMLRDPDNGGQTEYCGCGWPQHLYVPKGTVQGMDFDLFAMITNLEEDRVQDSPADLRIPEPCHSPYLLCGIPFRKYPDARPMGYPFDRMPYSVVDRKVLKPVHWLEEYAHYVPNMHSTVVRIQHQDSIVN